MGKLGWITLYLMCQGCAPSRGVVPAPPPAVFTPIPADPAAKAKITALAPKLEAFLRERFATSAATGMVAGIVLQGELVYEHSFGVLARGSSAAVSGESVFRVASLSKSFSALALLQLRDAGKLSLDVPVTEYLPELKSLRGLAPDAAPITARMLLTHSAGLPWDDMWGAVSFGFGEADLDALLHAGAALAREPGSAFEYSNLGYALIGRLIARLSGLSFEAYMTQHLLRPLGMRSTAWNARALPRERMAVGYWGDQEPLTEAPRVGDGVFEPAGGMYTTLHDYARYLAFQLNAYPARAEPDRGPVRRSTLRETHQPQRAAPRFEQPIAARTESGVELQESNHGFGWFNETSCAYRERIEHGGWEPGYHAGVIMLPAQRIAIVTMSTSQPVRAAEGMLKLLRETDALPAPLEAAASAELVAARQRVIQLLELWDDTVAQQTFDARSAQYPWYAHVKTEFPRLARRHGRCEPDGGLHVISRLAGSWKMHCERGTLELQVELTPTESPRVLLLRWTELLPPDERMSQRARQLVAAIGGAQHALDELLAPSLDHERVSKRLAHAAIDHGSCSIDNAIAGDGHTESTFALTCKSGALELSLELDEPGQVSDVDLHRPRAPRAVCWQ